MSYKDLFLKMAKNMQRTVNIMQEQIQISLFRYLTPPWRKTVFSKTELDSIRRYSKTFDMLDLKSDKVTEQLCINWIENTYTEDNHRESYTNLLIMQSSDAEHANRILEKISYYYKQIRDDKIHNVIDLDFRWVNRFTRYETFSHKVQVEMESCINSIYLKNQDKLLEVVIALLKKRYDAGFFKSVIIYHLETILDNNSLFRLYSYDKKHKEDIYITMEDGTEPIDTWEYLQTVIKQLVGILNIPHNEMILTLLKDYASIIELENRNANINELNNIEVS